MPPVVSIGMPVYNGEKYIREALDSLLTQTFTDFELIISDNASMDGTEEICQKYAAKDSRIRYVRQSENRGAMANFQFVLDEARGKYFMWATHDDLLSTKLFLELLVSMMSKGYDYVFPNVNIVNQVNGDSEVGVMSIFDGIEGRYEFAKASIKINSYQIYGLFRRDVLNRYFHFLAESNDMKCFNEGLFVHAISIGAKGGYAKNATKIYRRHLENASSTVPPPRMLRDFLRYYMRTLLLFFNASSLTAIERALILLSVLKDYSIYSVFLVISCLKNLVTRRHV